ncbi:MAG: TatD family hydrolase, partial [Erysipelotrichaceae bacterium]|nr:TatD family hydrolase [Erysipelotrichaceae bacterium]
GKRNEPSYVVHTGTFLAEKLGIPVEDFQRITEENYLRLFTRESYNKD